jgi:hypothetical protein
MQKNKISPIAKDVIDNYKEALNNISALHVQIDERVEYIINKICNTFNVQLDWWSYSHSDDNGGEFCDAYSEDQITPCINLESDYNPCVILLNNGSEWGLMDGIPIDWLFEDFEEELVNGKAAYIKQQEDKKNKAKAKKLDKRAKEKELLEQIKSKLSPEELKVLKLKKK